MIHCLGLMLQHSVIDHSCSALTRTHNADTMFVQDISMPMPTSQDTCHATGMWVRGAMVGALWLLLLHCWLCIHLKMERDSMGKDETLDNKKRNFITGSEIWYYFLSFADASIAKGQVEDAYPRDLRNERQRNQRWMLHLPFKIFNH
jgi:hypothetical protein